MKNVTRLLAGEIANLTYNDLPVEVIEKIKLAIMDDVGIAYLSYLYYDKPLIRFAKDIGGFPEATLIGDGSKVSCYVAAGVNAEMAGDSNMNETGPGVHALSSIAQTGIAVAEKARASGKELITAVAISYEINGRLVSNLQNKSSEIHIFPEHERRHLCLNTAVCAAKLFNLNEDEIERAMGIAWMFSPPSVGLFLKAAKSSSWIRGQLNLFICSIGIQAALMAKNGTGGPVDILSNGGDEIYDREKLITSPASYHYVMNELGLKPWVGSYDYMGGLEMVKKLVSSNKIRPSDIEQVIFRGSSLYTGKQFAQFNNPDPKDYFNAFSNVVWGITMLILGYESAVDWVSEERLNDSKAKLLAKKIKTEVAESPFVNEIEIITKKGVYKEKQTNRDWLGSARRPMSNEMIDSKFLGLASKCIGEKQAKSLMELFRNLEKVSDVTELTNLYTSIKNK